MANSPKSINLFNSSLSMFDHGPE
jgi:hypothetical protein